jgi:hypothetical protein
MFWTKHDRQENANIFLHSLLQRNVSDAVPVRVNARQIVFPVK